MTLLDELLIRIKADTDGAEKSLERTEKKTDSLGESFSKMAFRAAGALAAIASVGSAVSAAISRATDIEALDRTANALKINITELDAFGRAFEDLGGNAQTARTVLTTVAQSIGAAITDMNSSQGKAFQSLGINIKKASGEAKSSIDIMRDLSGAVEGMGREQATFKLSQLGITDNATIEMIFKGRKELDRMIKSQKENGAVTKEQAKRAIAFNESLRTLKQGISDGANMLSDKMMPALKAVVDWLITSSDWISEHKHIFIGAFALMAGALTAVYTPTVIAAATATSLLGLPLIAVIALIAGAGAAFVLLYDDIMNFIDGNDALIGQIFEKYPMIKGIVFGLIDVFKQAWSTATEFGAAILDAFSPLKEVMSELFTALEPLLKGYISILADGAALIAQILGVTIGGAFKLLGAVIGAVMDGIIATIKFAVSYIVKAVGGIVSAVNAVKEAGGKVANFLGFGDDDESGVPDYKKDAEPKKETGNDKKSATLKNEIGNDKEAGLGASRAGVRAANAQLSSASKSGLNAVTSNAISNSASNRSETNMPIGEININTQATDAGRISRDIGDSLKDQIRGLNAQTATGAAR